MPLTDRGRAILDRLPDASFRSAGSTGCAIVRHEELCVGCGSCTTTCPTGASGRGDAFDPNQLLSAPAGSRRGELGAALARIARHAPAGLIQVPPRVTVYRTILYDQEKCLGCGACARACPAEAIEALAPDPLEKSAAASAVAHPGPDAAVEEAQR